MYEDIEIGSSEEQESQDNVNISTMDYTGSTEAGGRLMEENCEAGQAGGGVNRLGAGVNSGRP